MKHLTYVKGFEGNLEELAKSVGNMTYDKFAEFIGYLAKDIYAQGENDLEKGRKQLASKLYSIADELKAAEKIMWSAWKICEPYMKE